jgi:tRNA-binding protein
MDLGFSNNKKNIHPYTMATIGDFQGIEIRLGTILTVEDFPEARQTSYKITVDFGEKTGVKKSSAQLVDNYKKHDLVGKQVLGVVNLPPRQIGPFISEVLIIGIPDSNNNCVLLKPDWETPIGALLY